MCCGSITNYFPTWLGGKQPLDHQGKPYLDAKGKPITGNFREVYLYERNTKGEYKADETQLSRPPLILHYREDLFTHELYKYTGNEPGELRMKSFLIAIFAVPYAGAVVIADCFRIIGAIASVAYKAFAQLYCDYVKFGFCGATGEFFNNLGRGIRDEIWPLMREILMTPFALPILEAGAIFSLIFPEEGMLVIDFAQRFWFNATFHKDPRYKQEHPESANDNSPGVCFIAYCMMSRGNMADLVGDRTSGATTWSKFEEVDFASPPPSAPSTPSKRRINSGAASLSPAATVRSSSLDSTSHPDGLQFE